MFPAALAEAAGFRRPTAVICHTFFYRLLDGWRAQLERLNGMRKQAGFDALPGLDDLWMKRDRIVVTTLRQFDSPPVSVPCRVHHAGPVFEDEKRARPAELPWPETDSVPLVVVSFSTVTEQRMPQNLQRTLDALAELPVRVVAATGAIVDSAELSVPANAHVVAFAAHDPLMQRAALLVTHGGHGTAMRALSHGLPMVLMPALAHDQPMVGAMVQEWGAGRALPTDASVEAIREAAREVLSSPCYRASARRLAGELAGVDGAASAAVELEAMLA
jgi:MGT family glycosyltransferase